MEDITNTPAKRTVTYAMIVVNYCIQKDGPNRVRITVGVNLVDYPGKLTTYTANLTTTKIMWNNVISTEDPRYA